jgi:hypothetical protein
VTARSQRRVDVLDPHARRLIGISLLVGAMFSGASALTGTAASGLPLPFLLGFVTVSSSGRVLERAATTR